MKQLLIVDSTTSLNGGISAPKDLFGSAGMPKGAIGFYHLDTPGSWLAAKPTKDFAIVLGRGADSPAFVIPEVDIHTLSVVKATGAAGTAFSASITIPTTEEGSTYTLVLVKKGVVPHQRNTWTATETVYNETTQTAAVIAAKLGAYFEKMAVSDGLNITVSVSTATITITANDKHDSFTLKAADDLYGETVTETAAVTPVGDKVYMENLASMCAAGKGFTDTYRDGDTIYPNYPEAIEDNKLYNIYTLRFAVGRKSAKTRDERVYQLVHVAVPASATTLAGAINTILIGS